jgi:hypothetical protein
VSHKDSLDERGEALFAAARRERPTDVARSRALANALAAIGSPLHADGVEEPTEGEQPSHEARAVRLARRATFGVTITVTLAAATTVILLLQGQRGILSLSPSPERVGAGGADGRSNRGASESRQSPAAPPSSSGTSSGPGIASAARTRSGAIKERDAGARSRASAPSLDDEVNALDQVRTALAAGDARKALERLARYQDVLHGTRLAAEATLLRIEALAETGRKDEAARIARRFIDANPGNPLVDRARTFAEGPAKPSASGVHTRGDSP